jgi:hypothetical protein
MQQPLSTLLPLLALGLGGCAAPGEGPDPFAGVESSLAVRVLNQGGVEVSTGIPFATVGGNLRGRFVARVLGEAPAVRLRSLAIELWIDRDGDGLRDAEERATLLSRVEPSGVTAIVLPYDVPSEPGRLRGQVRVATETEEFTQAVNFAAAEAE